MSTGDTEELKVPKRVALYIRVSSQEQKEMYGQQMQERALRALIQSKSIVDEGQVPEMVLADERYIYKDDISGATPLHERPMFSKLLHDLAASDKLPFDVLAVYKIDRIARSLKVLLSALDVVEHYKLQLISASESIDTTTSFGKAILGIVGVIAELERNNIAERTSGGKAVAIDDGKVMGSHAEYGYAKNLAKKRIILEEEAKIVRRIFFEYVHGKLSPELIAKQLTLDRVYSPESSAILLGKVQADDDKKNESYFWNPSAVRAILANETYLGVYYYGKSKKDKKTGKVLRIPKEQWKVSPERHDAIIGTKLFYLAQKRTALRRSNNETIQRSKDDYVYLLSGLLECDHCKNNEENSRIKWGGTKKEKPKGSKNYFYSYVCGRKNVTKFSKICEVIPIPAHQLEQYVVEFVQALLKDPYTTYNYQINLRSSKLHIKHLGSRIEHLRKLINAVPQMQERLREQHTIGVLAKEDLEKKFKESNEHRAKCEEDLERLENEKDQSELPVHYITAFEEYKEKYGPKLEEIFNDRERTKALLSHLISSIVIYSRKKKPEEKLAGRKKVDADQYIPHSIQIVLKLPVEIILHLQQGTELSKQFLAGNDNL